VAVDFWNDDFPSPQLVKLVSLKVRLHLPAMWVEIGAGKFGVGGVCDIQFRQVFRVRQSCLSGKYFGAK